MLRISRCRGLAVCLALGVALAACGTDGRSSDDVPVAGASSATSAPVGGVVREVLGQTVDPPGAPGRTLSLVRYDIPPGAKLSPHVHPGVQMASIEEGTLSYHVVEGTATVSRATDRRGGEPGASEAITGPATTTLGPGDTVVETGDMVHYGANETDQPVIILATLLTEDGKDLAVTVTTSPGQ